MLQYIRHSIPEKYRLITFFVATSVIGVLLIFFAVYNASTDLEVLSDLENTHRFLKLELADYKNPTKIKRKLLSEEGYQFYIIDKNRIMTSSEVYIHPLFPLEMTKLEKSRKNEYGGYVELENNRYIWAITAIEKTQKHLLLVHEFKGTSVDSLISIYYKRLFVPGIFYIWLMVWVALILRFLTEKLISQNEELEHKALHDGLTGLPNRILLNEQIKKAIKNCQRNNCKFALAVIDLNKFKEVNDTYGHDQGDELLCLVSKRVNNVLRTSDFLARIGGDEFVLLFNDADEKSSFIMCERIQSSVLDVYSLREACVNIGISIGIAIFPEHGQEPKTLMRNADLAMYEIKAEGGGIKLYKGNE